MGPVSLPSIGQVQLEELVIAANATVTQKLDAIEAVLKAGGQFQISLIFTTYLFQSDLGKFRPWHIGIYNVAVKLYKKKVYVPSPWRLVNNNGDYDLMGEFISWNGESVRKATLNRKDQRKETFLRQLRPLFKFLLIRVWETFGVTYALKCPVPYCNRLFTAALRVLYFNAFISLWG